MKIRRSWIVLLAAALLLAASCFGAVFAAYLAALLVWVAVQAALDNSIKGVFSVVGGGE